MGGTGKSEKVNLTAAGAGAATCGDAALGLAGVSAEGLQPLARRPVPERMTIVLIKIVFTETILVDLRMRRFEPSQRNAPSRTNAFCSEPPG